MEDPNVPRQLQTITVPAQVFNDRLDELVRIRSSPNQPGSVHSRLALIHQTAKAFASDALIASGQTPIDLTVDELTDPPLYGSSPDDEPVIIQFSFLYP